MPDEKREIVGTHLLDRPYDACSLRIFQLLPQVVFFQVALHGEPGGTQLFCVPRHLDEVASPPHKKDALCLHGAGILSVLEDRQDALKSYRAADGRNIFSRKRSNEAIIAAATEDRRGKAVHNRFINGPGVVIHPADESWM